MSYREKTGEFCVSGVNGSWGHSAYYKFENGTVTDQGSAEIAFYSLFDDDADDEYYIGDSNDSVSEKKYNDYMDSFGDYDTVITGYYTSIWDAYDNFDEQ
jgi:hypothetical protein